MINIDVNTSTHRQTEHNTSVITTDVTNDTDNNSPTLAVCPCRLLTFLLAATSHICVKPLYVPTAIKLPCQTNLPCYHTVHQYATCSHYKCAMTIQHSSTIPSYKKIWFDNTIEYNLAYSTNYSFKCQKNKWDETVHTIPFHSMIQKLLNQLH